MSIYRGGSKRIPGIQNVIDTLNLQTYLFRAKRYGCYRVIVATLLGSLGSGYRVRLPACIIEAVRQKWPSADGIYTGFKLESIFDE